MVVVLTVLFNGKKMRAVKTRDFIVKLVRSSAVFVFLFTLIAGSAQAENWPHWRGPAMNGASAESGLPERFSPTENVKWSLDMPGISAAVPIVWEDRVFLTTIDEAAGTMVAWCVAREDGKTIWKKVIAEGTQKDDKSNFAAPSPVTDGETVLYFYSKGLLIAFDLDGEERWRKDIQREYGEFAFGWTFSSSPLIHDGKVLFQLLQRDVEANGFGKPEGNESVLLGFDLKSGKEVWKVDRPSKAVMESREAFTSPVIQEINGEKQLLVVGGDCLTGHDPETGEEKWRWGTWNPGREPFWRLVPSPVAGGGVVLACAPKKNPVYAIKPGEGVLGDSNVAWVSEDAAVSSDVPTPVFYGGYFYILNGNSTRPALSCVEPRSGKVVWSESLASYQDKKGKFEASVTAGDGKIYLMNKLGHVFVAQAGKQFKMLHHVAMGGNEQSHVRSSIAMAGGNLFIRTDTKLFCIGN